MSILLLQAAAGLSSGGGGGSEPVDPDGYRFWRLVVSDNPRSTVANTYEMELREELDVTQFATGGVVTESGHDGSNAATGMFDGSTTTGYWRIRTENMPQWATYEFPVKKKIVQVALHASPGYGNNTGPGVVSILASNSGVDWLVLAGDVNLVPWSIGVSKKIEL